MLPKINPENTTAWKALNEHFANNDFELRTLFQYNPKRFDQFSVKRENYLFDSDFSVLVDLQYSTATVKLDSP